MGLKAEKTDETTGTCACAHRRSTDTVCDLWIAYTIRIQPKHGKTMTNSYSENVCDPWITKFMSPRSPTIAFWVSPSFRRHSPALVVCSLHTGNEPIPFTYKRLHNHISMEEEGSGLAWSGLDY